MAIAIAVALFAFAVDISTTLGVAPEVLYVIAVLATLSGRPGRTVWGVASVAAALALVGFGISAARAAPTAIVYVNLGLSLVAIWVAAILVSHNQRTWAHRRATDRAALLRFEQISRACPDALLLVDAKGTIRFASERTHDLFGWAPHELVGRSVDALVPESVRAAHARHRAAYLAARDSGPLNLGLDLHAVRSNGELVSVNISIASADGLVAVAVRDDTERRRLERSERQKLQEALLHAQRVDAVGRLASGIAHDFNNLLGVVLMHAQLLAQELPNGHPHRADAESILQAAKRGAKLTKQLLAFSRKEPGEPTVLDPNDLIRNVSGMLRRLLGEDVQLILGLEADLGAVRIDEGQFEQALVNLCVNARDAMSAGDTLTIRTYPTTDGLVVVEVADTGHGMDQATLDRVFEPFFTTKSSGRGTGLGLSSAQAIVTQANGMIDAVSTPGSGTSVRIQLPRVDEPPSPLQATPSSDVPRETGKGQRILVVEDEDKLRLVILRVLEAAGYAVSGAANLATACEVGEMVAPDLLLCDLVLPDGSGLAVAAALKKRLPGLRVLCMTGYAEDDPRRVTDAPDLQMLRKPFTESTLVSRVNEVLGMPSSDSATSKAARKNGSR